MQNHDLIKYQVGLINHVGNAIGITNKLLVLTEPQLIPYRKKDKWGFCTADKKIVISCEFEKVKQFSEGAAVVKKSGKYGFVEPNANITNNGLLRNFVDLNSLHEGLAKASINIHNRKWGLVNKENSEVIGFVYDDISNFCEGLARVRLNKKCGFIDRSNAVVVPFLYDNAHSFSNGFANVRIGNKWGYIDKNGQTIIPIEIDSLEILDGLTGNSETTIYPKPTKIGNKYCLMDRDNYPLNNLEYDCIDNRDIGFCEDLIDVCVNDKWGFVNRDGALVIPCIYDDVFPFSEGLACALRDEYWGYIDKMGQEVIGFIYDEVFPFSDGIAKVIKDGKNWVEGYINKTGIEYWED